MSNDALTNKERLRKEIKTIQHEIEHKLGQLKEDTRHTAEVDRRNLERKAHKIKETLKDGWENVSEATASALLKILK